MTSLPSPNWFVAFLPSRHWPAFATSAPSNSIQFEGCARNLLLIYVKLDFACSPGAGLRRRMLRRDLNV
jgi:hypothetical protein